MLFLAVLTIDIKIIYGVEMIKRLYGIKFI